MQINTLAIAIFIAWLLILAGVIVFYITWHGFRDGIGVKDILRV